MPKALDALPKRILFFHHRSTTYSFSARETGLMTHFDRRPTKGTRGSSATLVFASAERAVIIFLTLTEIFDDVREVG